ncbi:hypothetical protein CQW23_23175 [Capsicum baccatum]|uniref:WRKY domain-containing protein n=1 Tax=Capsicum baccatum TaxID=33114 RepID=A0A2G2VR75_CAPBA|nr:hypothetical protein CQW23_23175 [Capsicum baccatum]
MGDDHVAIFGDWITPSPSPRAFVSSLLVDDVGGWLPRMEHTNESNCRNFNAEPQQNVTALCSTDGKDGARAGASTDQTVKSSAPSEQKPSTRGGGLMERMVARSGFHAPRLNTDGLRPPVLSQNQEARSPYLTIPPGLSPSVLLYSPVLIYNPLVCPSPTTGLLPLASGDESKSLMLTAGIADKRKETAFGSNNSSSFSSNPVNPSSDLSQQLLPQIEVSAHPNNSLQPQSMEVTQSEQIRHGTSKFPMLSTEEDFRGSHIKPEVRPFNIVGGSMQHSQTLDEQKDEDTKQRGGGDSKDVNPPAEDGYNWRKYGQNQANGRTYPRSYYKCAYPKCPVKKRVGGYHDCQVMEIIYKGIHNHPKPLSNPISALGSLNSFGDVQRDNVDPSGTGFNSELALATSQQGPTAKGLMWSNNKLEATSLAALHSEYCSGSTTLQSKGAQQGSADAVEVSSVFSNDEDDHGTRGSVLLGYDGAEDEFEPKRRKSTVSGTSGTIRAIREPRVVVHTISEVDIIDDGYRWRKYGQKVVKGNPNPRLLPFARSYYKCTSSGCNVRKHIERSPYDQKSVITTYDGKHYHEVPPARTSSQGSSGASKSPSNPITTDAQSHVGRPEPTQVQNTKPAQVQNTKSTQVQNTNERYGRAPQVQNTNERYGRAPQVQNTNERYGRAPSLGSAGPISGFDSFGTNEQQDLPSLAMAGFNFNQHQFSVPLNPYIGWQRPVNDADFVLPEGEAMPDPNLNYSNGSSTYQQIMNGLPPQM